MPQRKNLVLLGLLVGAAIVSYALAPQIFALHSQGRRAKIMPSIHASLPVWNLIGASTISNQLGMPDDTVYYVVYPYYQFTQYYDTARVTFYFGEAVLHRYGTTPIRMQLGRYDPINHSPFATLTLAALADSSMTNWVVVSNMDTISYYCDLSVECEHQGCKNIGMKDSLLFYVELIDSISNSSISTLDTLGLRPCDIIDSVGCRYVHGSDTSIVRRRIVSNLTGTRKLALKIRPYFFGSSNDELVGRWDVTSDRAYSELAADMRIFTLHILDSLSALAKRVPPSKDKQIREQFVLRSLNYEVGSSILSISYDLTVAASLEFRVFDLSGRLLQTIRRAQLPALGYHIREHLPWLSSGTYYVGIALGGTTVSAGKFTVIH